MRVAVIATVHGADAVVVAFTTILAGAFLVWLLFLMLLKPWHLASAFSVAVVVTSVAVVVADAAGSAAAAATLVSLAAALDAVADNFTLRLLAAYFADVALLLLLIGCSL